MKRFLPLLILVLALLPACGRKGDLIIPGTVLPQAVTGLTAEPGDGAILLAWTMPEKNTEGDPLTDLTGFIVLRAELPEGRDECPCMFQKAGYVDIEFPKDAVVKGRRVVWADRGPGLATGGKYGYKVAPVNRDGFTGLESGLSVVRLLDAPAAPAGLKAKPGKGSVTLAWEPVIRDKSGHEVGDPAGFNVYRSEAPGEFTSRPINGQPVRGGEYKDTGLVDGAAYYYRVSALRGTVPPYTEGDPAPPVSATPADTEPPAPPAGFQAVPGEGMVLLSWDPDTEPDLAGYRVYRKGRGETGFMLLTEKPINRISYTDTSVASGGVYAYLVTAVDDAVPPNESGHSAEVTVTVP